jgi:hypothetical protein
MKTLEGKEERGRRNKACSEVWEIEGHALQLRREFENEASQAPFEWHPRSSCRLDFPVPSPPPLQSGAVVALDAVAFLCPFRCLGCLRSGGIYHALRPDTLSLLSFSKPLGLQLRVLCSSKLFHSGGLFLCSGFRNLPLFTLHCLPPLQFLFFAMLLFFCALRQFLSQLQFLSYCAVLLGSEDFRLCKIKYRVSYFECRCLVIVGRVKNRVIDTSSSPVGSKPPTCSVTSGSAASDVMK